MSELVARTGRHQQRYEDGYRLIAGCIPFRYSNDQLNWWNWSFVSKGGGWENDETAEEAAEREAMEEAGVGGNLVDAICSRAKRSRTNIALKVCVKQVKEELESWITITEAIERCRYAWMRESLENGFSNWYGDGMIRTLPEKRLS